MAPHTPTTITVKSIHHQNSAREARPLKSQYLLKQMLTDSMNVMVWGIWGAGGGVEVP